MLFIELQIMKNISELYKKKSDVVSFPRHIKVSIKDYYSTHQGSIRIYFH